MSKKQPIKARFGTLTAVPILYELRDTCDVEAAYPTVATLGPTEGADTCAITGLMPAKESLAIVEARDTAQILGTVSFLSSASLNITEFPDNVSIGTLLPFTLVRTNTQYSNFADAHTAAQDGDTILVQPQIYDFNYSSTAITNSAWPSSWAIWKNLTIRSAVAGQRYQLRKHATDTEITTISIDKVIDMDIMDQRVPNATTRFVCSIEDAEIYLNPTQHSPASYGSAGNTALTNFFPTYLDGLPANYYVAGQGDVTWRRCYFHNAGTMITGSSEYVNSTSTMTFENCIFELMGNSATPNNHFVYFGHHIMTFTGCSLRGLAYPGYPSVIATGHMIKNTAHKLVVEACRLTNETGGSWPGIESEHGRNITAMDCYFEMSASADAYDSSVRWGASYSAVDGQHNIDDGYGNAVTLLRNTFVNNTGTTSSGYVKITYGGSLTPPNGNATYAVTTNIQYNLFMGPDGNYPTGSAANLVGAPYTNNHSGPLTELTAPSSPISGWSLITPIHNGTNWVGADQYIDYTDATTQYPTWTARTDDLWGASAAVTLPAWRQALGVNTITDISTNTMNDAFVAAGYDLAGWHGDGGDNCQAWGAGVLAPTFGTWGSLLTAANGHELEPASTIHCFDCATATWLTPVAAPSLWRQITALQPPPTGAVIWYDPSNFAGYTVQSSVSNTAASHVGNYSIVAPPWVTGGCYATNIGAGWRYDMMVFVPSSYGGEPAGTVVSVAPGLVHEWNAPAEILTHYTWRYGLTSQAWLAHSTDAMPAGARGNLQGNSALSKKYSKIFTATYNIQNMGIYDPVANSHSQIPDNQSISAAYVLEGAACVTEGFSSHLFICTGRARDSNELCLVIYDLDAAILQAPSGSYSPWALQNKTSTNTGPQKLRLLTPSVNFQISANDSTACGTVQWSQTRQQLILFQAGSIAPPGYTGTIQSYHVYTITIPTNWKTDDWVVVQQQLTYGAGTTTFRLGNIQTCYKRFSWSDALDCAIYAARPNDAPVQAIRIW